MTTRTGPSASRTARTAAGRRTSGGPKRVPGPAESEAAGAGWTGAGSGAGRGCGGICGSVAVRGGLGVSRTGARGAGAGSLVCSCGVVGVGALAGWGRSCSRTGGGGAPSRTGCGRSSRTRAASGTSRTGVPYAPVLRWARTARQRVTVPRTKTARTRRTIASPIRRPQKRPYPDSWSGGVAGQAAGRSVGAVARERRAGGVPVKATPSGQAPWANRPARPVAVHTRTVRQRRRANRLSSSPSEIPPPPFRAASVRSIRPTCLAVPPRRARPRPGYATVDCEEPFICCSMSMARCSVSHSSSGSVTEDSVMARSV